MTFSLDEGWPIILTDIIDVFPSYSDDKVAVAVKIEKKKFVFCSTQQKNMYLHIKSVFLFKITGGKNKTVQNSVTNI